MGRLLFVALLVVASAASAQTTPPAPSAAPSGAPDAAMPPAPSLDQIVSDPSMPTLSPRSPEPSPAAPAPALDGERPAEPTQAAAPSPSPSSRVVEWINRSVSVPNRTVVLKAPQDDAAILSVLHEGAAVQVMGILSDAAWLQLRLPDDSIGYVRAGTLPAATGSVPAAQAAIPQEPPPAGATPSPARPELVEGFAVIQDTSTLAVRPGNSPASATDRTIAIKLFGLDGFGGPPRDAMAAYLAAKDNWVTCQAAPAATYLCHLNDGTDLAKIVLVNGAARVSPDAPADYKIQQGAAIEARRGIWSGGTAAVDAIPFSVGSAAPPPRGEFVDGVPYAPDGAVPTFFAAAGPQEGLAFIDEQPFTLDDGVPVAVIYDPALGWGFWDHSYKWRTAPHYWAGRLDHFHYHGEGLRRLSLEHFGYPHGEGFYRGPIAHAAFAVHGPERLGERLGERFGERFGGGPMRPGMPERAGFGRPFGEARGPEFRPGGPGFGHAGPFPGRPGPPMERPGFARGPSPAAQFAGRPAMVNPAARFAGRPATVVPGSAMRPTMAMARPAPMAMARPAPAAVARPAPAAPAPHRR